MESIFKKSNFISSLLIFIGIVIILFALFSFVASQDGQENNFINTTLNLSQRCSETSLVTVNNGKFYCNNQSGNQIEFKFFGVNIRPLPFIDEQLLPDGSYDNFEYEVREQIIAASKMNATVIRIYAPYRNKTVSDSINRIKTILDISAEIDPSIKFYITLTDFVKASNFWVQGDESYYTRGNNQYLNDEWFTDGYKNNYRPFVENLAGDAELKNDPRIFAWQLVNEGQSGNGNDMYNFVSDMGNLLKNEIGVSQLVNPGFLQIDHAFYNNVAAEGRSNVLNRVYKNSNMDFGSLNIYNSSIRVGKFVSELQWYGNNNVPFIVGEFSVNADTSDRKQQLFNHAKSLYQDYGASGVLQWGFYSGVFSMGSDLGSGFLHFGMDDWITTPDASTEILAWGGMYSAYACIADYLQTNSSLDICNPANYSNPFSTFNYSYQPGEVIQVGNSWTVDWEDVAYSGSGDFVYDLVLWNEDPQGAHGSYIVKDGLTSSSVTIPSSELNTNDALYGFQVYIRDTNGYVAHGSFQEVILQNEDVVATPTDPPEDTIDPSPTSISDTPEPTEIIILCGSIDPNEDGTLNAIDLASFVIKYRGSCDEDLDYLDTTCGPTDTNNDGILNAVDLGSFASVYRTDCSTLLDT